MNITSKQRSYLKGLAMNIDTLFQVGHEGVTPEFTASIREAIDKRELIKIGVLKNCDFDKKEIATMLAERTGSELVQIIGNKIVLYKFQKDDDKRRIDIRNV